MKRFIASPQMYILVFIRLNDVTYYFLFLCRLHVSDAIMSLGKSSHWSSASNQTLFRVNPRHSLMLSRPTNLQPPLVSSNMKRLGAFSMSFGVSLNGQ